MFIVSFTVFFLVDPKKLMIENEEKRDEEKRTDVMGEIQTCLFLFLVNCIGQILNEH